MSQHNSWASWHTPANAGDTGDMWVQSLGQEDPVKGEIAACPSIIAWKIPWTVEPGELQSMGLQRVGCDWAQHNSRTDFERLWSKNQFYKNCLFCGMIKVILLSLVTLSIFKKKTKSVKGNNSSHYPYCVCVSLLALYDPMDCSPPGSSVHGIFWARILEWIAISLSRGSSQPRDQTQLSGIAGRLFTLWANIPLLYNNYLIFFCSPFPFYICGYGQISIKYFKEILKY